MHNHDNIQLCHGYTLRDIERLAQVAVHRDFWHQSLPFPDRLDTAWSAIAEHLYSCNERPAAAALIRAAWSALRHEAEDEWHTHGVSRTLSVYDGDTVMLNFLRYWHPQAQHTPSPEEQIIDRMALYQIWAALPQQHQQVLRALADHDDYGRAAQFLGRTRNTLVTQISKARRDFLALWHEGETPSRPWGTDRRRNPDKPRHNLTRAMSRRKGKEPGDRRKWPPICTDLQNQITRGELTEGDTLTAYRTGEKYHVHRKTAAKALDMLASNGYLLCQSPGRYTVTHPPKEPASARAPHDATAAPDRAGPSLIL